MLAVFVCNLSNNLLVHANTVIINVVGIVSTVAFAQGQLSDAGYRQSEEALSQGDETGGSWGDVVRVWGNAFEMRKLGGF